MCIRRLQQHLINAPALPLHPQVQINMESRILGTDGWVEKTSLTFPTSGLFCRPPDEALMYGVWVPGRMHLVVRSSMRSHAYSTLVSTPPITCKHGNSKAGLVDYVQLGLMMVRWRI